MDRIRIFHICGIEREPEETEKLAFRKRSEDRFAELTASVPRHGDAFLPGVAGHILEPPEFSRIFLGIENQSFHPGLFGDTGKNGKVIADAVPVRIGKPVDLAGLDAGGDKIVGEIFEFCGFQIGYGLLEIFIFEFPPPNIMR